MKVYVLFDKIMNLKQRHVYLQGILTRDDIPTDMYIDNIIEKEIEKTKYEIERLMQIEV